MAAGVVVKSKIYLGDEKMDVKETSKCWMFDFENFVSRNTDGSETWERAKVYYLKADIARELTFRGTKQYTDNCLPDPGSRWSDDCLVSDVISHLVDPYRVTRY
jgi:hypothetical protein